MKKSTTRLLFLLMTGCFLNGAKGIQCSKSGTNGIAACQCNFIGACDAKGNPNPNLAQYLPTGVDQFGLVEGGQRNLAYLCEGVGAVGILYDCNNRIPLYAATVIHGAQLTGKSLGGRPSVKFSQSSMLDSSFQQQDGDYVNALKRELCYTTKKGGKYLVEEGWLLASGCRKRFLNCPRKKVIKTSVHRGHLIASQYGRNNQAKKKATFTYTNAVPQFGVFNSYPWQVCEKRLITWGNQNCAQVKGATDVRLFVVVGAMPSTVGASCEWRYFGRGGFSDYQNTAHYRVNVPSAMWTAACCTYSDKGTLKYRSTAFWRGNNPGKAQCNRANVGSLTSLLSTRVPGGTVSFNLFPQTSQCNDKKTHIPLP
ncbi:uncharacterized protein LOC111332082 [Stylophora pistillata]|uniref:uncharacterized protein LOC111332082 n=1 Tax=Stylophora pistillata TaxID=50429 RepID=UPI000C04A9F3|nr:uncharacterized protein LOC111332082 [Stylophora pistillata]